MNHGRLDLRSEITSRAVQDIERVVEGESLGSQLDAGLFASEFEVSNESGTTNQDRDTDHRDDQRRAEEPGGRLSSGDDWFRGPLGTVT